MAAEKRKKREGVLIHNITRKTERRRGKKRKGEGGGERGDRQTVPLKKKKKNFQFSRGCLLERGREKEKRGGRTTLAQEKKERGSPGGSCFAPLACAIRGEGGEERGGKNWRCVTDRKKGVEMIVFAPLAVVHTKGGKEKRRKKKGKGRNFALQNNPRKNQESLP